MPVFRRKAQTTADFPQTLERAARPAPTRHSSLFDDTGWTTSDRIFAGTVCLASVAFCVSAAVISVRDPDYFSQRLIASLQSVKLDPITTGTVETHADGGPSLPVPAVVRSKEPTPADYQIVMVFDDEAILATQTELVRIKVGSVVPGLGEITGIQQTAAGGAVIAQKATLKAAAN